MRTFLLIAGTFALLVGIFIGYTMTQTGSVMPNRPSSAADGPIELPVARDAIIGRGEQAWFKIFNEHWQVASQFRAAEYNPQADGRVHVTTPEYVFFLSGGELVRVRGREGVVVMSRLPGPEDGTSIGPAEPPSRGELKGVEIELFDSVEAMEADSADNNTSTLQVLLDNAAFDNQTFRIFTEAAAIDGQELGPDQIPVTVRGRDYEFDGRGLTIRWNERDRRLELLRIEHGERLVIRDPDRLMIDARPGRRDRGNSRQASLPLMLASLDASAAAEAISAPAPRSQRPSYRATFDRDVRIHQGDQQLVDADQMFIDFVFSGEKPDAPTSQPATQPRDAATAVPANARLAADETPSTQAAEPVAEADAANDATGEAPAEAEPAVPQPIIVYWNGPFVVTPAPADAPRPAEGAAIVHLVGQPLRLQRDGGDIVAASLIYDTGDERLLIDGTEQSPLVLKDAEGSVIQTQTLTYIPQQKRMELRGRSSATFPVRERADEEAQPLQAEWADRCVLLLSDGGLEQLAVQRAQLVGNVRITHPSVRLSSQALGLELDTDAASTQPADASSRMQLRRLTARGDVDCVIIDDQEQTQSIQADRLRLDTAVDDQGRLYPRQIFADGQLVRASDGQQTLVARTIHAILAPAAASGDATTQPTARIVLEKLIASDSAEYSRADGQRAAADRIEVVQQGDQPTITLLGNASIGDGNNILHGPHVQVLTDQQQARVIGAGSLQAMVETQAGTPPRPLTVEWSRDVVVDGKANRIDVNGDVVVTTATADGASHALTGESMLMTLADVEPDAANVPAAGQGNDGVKTRSAVVPELAQRKRVESITFERSVQVTSLRTAEDGKLLRRFFLRAPRLDYDPQQRQMVVPVAGQLLFEDHPQRPEHADAEASQLFGATAMAWEKRLVYDETHRHITLEGNVLIKHQPDEGQKQPPFELRAQTVRAELAESDSDQPAEGELIDRPDLRRLIADQNVGFKSRDIELTALRIEHDPHNGDVIATGTREQPVHISRGVTTGSFREARFNLRTEKLQVIDFRGNVRR